MRYGFICPPSPGHFRPMGMVAIELKRRGHQVFFLDNDHALNQERYYLNTLGHLVGEKADKKTIEFLDWHFLESMEHAPGKIRRHGIDALIVDEACREGRALSNSLSIPYITVSCALHYFFPWKETFSPVAHITQMIKELEIGNPIESPNFHYVGPLHKNRELKSNRQLIYVSMGTINNLDQEFLDSLVEKLPTNTIVASSRDYIDQLHILSSEASVFVTHAGMNSVLESIMAAVPMVCYPRANDQHAIAKMVEHHKIGTFGVSLQHDIMTAISLTENVRAMREKALKYGRVELAADIIEGAL